MATHARLQRLEKRRLPTTREVVCLSQWDFDTPDELHAEARRLEKDAAARGAALQLILLVYTEDWRGTGGDVVRLTWGD